MIKVFFQLWGWRIIEVKKEKELSWAFLFLFNKRWKVRLIFRKICKKEKYENDKCRISFKLSILPLGRIFRTTHKFSNNCYKFCQHNHFLLSEFSLLILPNFPIYRRRSEMWWWNNFSNWILTQENISFNKMKRDDEFSFFCCWCCWTFFCSFTSKRDREEAKMKRMSSKDDEKILHIPQKCRRQSIWS